MSLILCWHRSQCSRRTMIIFQKRYILAITKMQLVVTQTTFWPMEMGNQLLGFKIIFVPMVHTDGTTTWSPQSMLILSFFYNFFIYWLLFWGEERGDGSNLWHRDWGSGVGANWVTSPLALILSCFRNLMCMHFTINVSMVCACVHWDLLLIC